MAPADLLTPKGEMITNAEIAWATPVLWIKTQIRPLFFCDTIYCRLTISPH